MVVWFGKALKRNLLFLKRQVKFLLLRFKIKLKSGNTLDATFIFLATSRLI